MLMLFTARHRDCAVTFAGYTEKSKARTAPPIDFIAKSKARMRASELFDRKTS